jgi:hypothetical protein
MSMVTLCHTLRLKFSVLLVGMILDSDAAFSMFFYIFTGFEPILNAL